MEIKTHTPTGLILAALLIILLASAVRLEGLERMVVWHDEVFSAIRIFGHDQLTVEAQLFSGRTLAPADLLAFQGRVPEQGWADTWRALKHHPEHSPFYYLSARLAGNWIDDPLLALRGASALFGLLLAPAVFWLMRELFGPGKAAWIAAALVACSPLHILYAQEARQYALWTVLMAAAGAAFLRALRLGRARDWALYGGLVAAGLYSHLLFTLMLPVFAVYGWLTLAAEPPRLRRAGRDWVLATGLGGALFLPWVYVIASTFENLRAYTAWMAKPTTPAETFQSWGEHLLHSFADPISGAWMLLVPLAWLMWRFCTSSPQPARWFLCLMVAVTLGTVLLPDLMVGGSRSAHARYALPALLAIQLAVAQVLAAEWDSPAPVRRWASILAISALLLLGGWSAWNLRGAESSWTKAFSRDNAAIARLINASPRPLVVAGESGVAAGEMISLAWRLEPGVTLWGEPREGAIEIPQGFGEVFSLLPSERLQARLEQDYTLVPLLGTWQWCRLVPKKGQ